MFYSQVISVTIFLLTALVANAIEFNERERSKRFVLELEKPGNVLLELKKEYKGFQRAELMFIYDSVPMRWEQQGEFIELYRLPAYRDRGGEEELAFVLRDESTGGVLALEPKGILENPAYFEFFEDKAWQPANERKNSAYSIYQKSRRQPRNFYQTKSKGAFPEDTPAVLMNLAARLFRDRVHELRVALVFPGLDEPTLKVVAETMFNEEYDQNGLLQPLVAAHPNTPRDLRDRFFQSEKSYYKTHIWRAVAMRDDETKGRFEEYLSRIKEGKERDRILVARDQDAPKEAWQLAIASGEQGVLKSFVRNPNAPPEMIRAIFRSGALQYDARGMASNKQTPPPVLAELSNTENKQILWSLQRNPSTPEATIQKILLYFASNISASLRGHAARDERTPVELLKKLAQDVNTNVRVQVGMNKEAPVKLIEQLAEDSHQTPAARARETLMRHYKDVYVAKKESWTPLDQLNPHNNLSQEFTAAVKAGDEATARKLIEYTDDPETRIDEMTIVSLIQNYNFDGFKGLLRETLRGMKPKARGAIFKRDQVTPEQLKWGIEQGFVSSESVEEWLGDYTKKGRKDLIDVLVDAGMLDSVKKEIASQCLFMAVLIRDSDLTRFWLSRGGDPTLKIQEGVSALEAAKRFHSISILKLIDEDGRYSDFIEKIRRGFPKPENKVYVGNWSNRRDGFGESSLSLAEDGTGSLGATMVAITFLWKELSENTIEITMVDPESGELVDKRMELELIEKQEDTTAPKSAVSMLKAIDADQTYYRVPDQEN